MVVHGDSFSSGEYVNTVSVTDTCWPVEGEVIARLTGAFLRYHFDSVPGAYHSTNTAPFAVAIVNFYPIVVAVHCYGQVRAKQSAEITNTAPLLVQYRYMGSSCHWRQSIASPCLSPAYVIRAGSAQPESNIHSFQIQLSQPFWNNLLYCRS